MTEGVKHGVRVPRTRPAAERRADLLSAGRQLFVTKGVSATTLEDITRGAGVSKGLFYQYFRSKDDLLFALQEQFVTSFAAQVQGAIQAQREWALKLDACVQACFERFHAEDDLHEVLFRHTGPSAAEPDQLPAHHQLVEVIRELLAAGATAGAWQLDDPEATALLLFSAMHAFDPGFRDDTTLSDGRLITATQRLTRRAVGLRDPDLASPAGRKNLWRRGESNP